MDFVTINNRAIAYRRYGRRVDPARPPVVLLHGAGGNHLVWPARMRHLAATSVIAIDLPGHGESSPPACATIDTFTELVRDVVDALELDFFVLVGHSMGGAIALDFATAYAQRLAGLMVIGAGPTMPVSAKLIETLREDFAAATAMIVRYSYRRSAPEEELALYLSHLRQCNPEVLLEDLLACAAFDATENLAHLTLPTLIVCGQEDRMMPPSMSQALHAAVQGSELLVVPDAGHNVMVEHPDLVAGYLAQFIDRITADQSLNLQSPVS